VGLSKESPLFDEIHPFWRFFRPLFWTPNPENGPPENRENRTPRNPEKSEKPEKPEKG